MSTREITLDYDDEKVTFTVEGEVAFGAPHVLLDGDDNLIAGRAWEDDGFVVAPFLAPDDYQQLADGIRLTLQARVAAAGFHVPDDFSLARYHEVVTTDDAHAAVTARGPWCHALSELAVPAETISQRVSEILGVRVSTVPPHAEFPEHFCYRVVRPRSRATTRRTATCGSIACAMPSTSTCPLPAARDVPPCHSSADPIAGRNPKSSARRPVRGSTG